MAIVCVLSVFNGFERLSQARISAITPDLLITPAASPLIENADSLSEKLASLKEVEVAMPVVQGNALAYRGGYQIPVNILGVRNADYRKITGIDTLLMRPGKLSIGQSILQQQELNEEVSAAAGEFDEAALFADTPQEAAPAPEVDAGKVAISVGVAASVGLPPSFTKDDLMEEGLTLFVPRRTASSLNMANPVGSFMLDSLQITNVFMSDDNEFDMATVIMDLSSARALLEYDRQATSLYVKLKPGAQPDGIRDMLQPSYNVKDRLQQQSLNMRMVQIEKWITFLLLSFILIIASFNVISTVSMLIVDKRRDITTLWRLGASRSLIGEVYCWESAYICAIGMIAGMITGILLCLIQQHFGIIKLEGDASTLLTQVYPVRLVATDFIYILIPSLAIIFLTAIVASRYAKRQLSTQ